MNGLARRQVFFFCALAMIAARPWSVHAARIVLVRGGEAVATVVIPSDAPTVIRTAAEDLRHYVSAICGVDLPLRDDGSSVPGTGLYIGGCDAATAADLPGAELNPETYAIRVRDGSIFFTGRHPTPAAFAVFSFIEDTLGVRWFAPGELWEHVPPGTPGELAVDQDSLVKVPHLPSNLVGASLVSEVEDVEPAQQDRTGRSDSAPPVSEPRSPGVSDREVR
jgi:hypothetical protein